MKIDCNIATNYLIRKSQMTNSCTISCDECPLNKGSLNSFEDYRCQQLEVYCPNEAVRIVQEWSDSHPQITYKGYFKKCFPDADDDYFDYCLKNYFGKDIYTPDCDDLECKECWDKPIPNYVLDRLKEARKNEKD